MSRRTLALTAVLIALATPGAASAATWTVDPGAAAGCSGNTCKTIKDAVTAAAANDVISVKPSPSGYSEDPIDVNKNNLTIEAEQPGTVLVTSKSTTAGSHVFALSGTGVTLKGLVVSVQQNGGAAVSVSGANATIDQCYLAKQTTSTQEISTVLIDAALGSGTTTLKSSVVIHAPDQSAANDVPAVQGPTGNSTLAISDSFVVSGLESGPALNILGSSGAGHTIARSRLYAFKPAADAIRIFVALDHTSLVKLTADSSVLAAGQNGSGVYAETESGGGVPPGGSSAGDITIALNRVTVAGSTYATKLLANADGGSLPAPVAAGDVTMTVDRSIFHGRKLVQSYDGDGLLSASNTSTLTVTNSDAVKDSNDAATGEGATLNVNNSSLHTAAQLFRDPFSRDLRLRADAPVINQAGTPGGSESDKDVEGDPRVVGPAADTGADEFLNRAPTARVVVNPASPVQNQDVTLDASGSTDPEAGVGGAIAGYEWDFGDGSPLETTTGPVHSHRWAQIGTYNVTVRVTDNFGAVSALSDVFAVNVRDGIPPQVRIVAPKSNQRFKLYRTTKRKVGTRTVTTRRRNQIRFAGNATDAFGVRSVELSIRLVRSPPRRTATRSQIATCRYLNPTRKIIVGRRCNRALYFPISLREGLWGYRTKRDTRLRAGDYQATLRVTDNNGVQAVLARNFTIVD